MIRGLASFFDSDPEENLERWKVITFQNNYHNLSIGLLH